MATIPNVIVERDDSDQESMLEKLTEEYLLGKIRLEEYQEKVLEVGTRLDLRRAASKIKTGILQENHSK